MIGVISKKDESAVVEEFFQLFKTPWEMYRPGASYQVALITGDEQREVDAELILIYGSETRASDQEAKLISGGRTTKTTLIQHGKPMPLYGEAMTFEPGGRRIVCMTENSEAVGIELSAEGPRVLRIGFNLFQEVRHLLTAGQPIEAAHVPTLELHVRMLRDLILDAGLSVLEIPPVPAGYDFAACLTHDIDFVGIRRHRGDHTMWGFLYRSTLGAMWECLRGSISVARLLKAWKAAASLPFVYLGWCKDFWVMFDWYLEVENGLPATYFLIPFKGRCGEKVGGKHASRRATAYDIADIPDWAARLQSEGCEVGVHGIDAWHSVGAGREELKRVVEVTGQRETGIRMHWLLRDESSFRVLEEAGYSYDSTVGYNEAPGYRCGTTQVFRPLSARRLLELPMHIQDGALFFPNRLGLSEAEAWKRCEAILSDTANLGGVVTLLWHDRSPGPERFWGDFYRRLVGKLKSLDVWFGSAGQIVGWFGKRRQVMFQCRQGTDGVERISLSCAGQRVFPPLRIRIHPGNGGGNGSGLRGASVQKMVDIAWDGDTDLELGPTGASLGGVALDGACVSPRG